MFPQVSRILSLLFYSVLSLTPFFYPINASPISQDEWIISVHLKYPGGGDKIHSVLDGLLPHPMCIPNPNHNKWENVRV